jgi:hypothetical protein
MTRIGSFNQNRCGFKIFIKIYEIRNILKYYNTI